MATQNRGTRITKLLGKIKKQYKPLSPPPSRTLVEHLLFACLLENSPHEKAEAAFEMLQRDYFDWNEVRVSTKRELAEALKGLYDPDRSAERLKRSLHSIFESVYAYDLEPLKKQNLGQATKQIADYEGVSPFAVAYVTQNALSGHAIPANNGLLVAFVVFDIIKPSEAAKSSVPGLERTIPKAKGVEVATILHQLGVEVGKNPYGTNARKALLAIEADCKARLPKKPEPPKPKKPTPKKPAPVAKANPSKEKPSSKAKPATKAAPQKAAPASSKKTAAKAPAKPTKKATVKKKVVKKVVKKVKPTSKSKSGKSKLGKSKPGKKATKKVAKKKAKASPATKKKAKITTKTITKRKPK